MKQKRVSERYVASIKAFPAHNSSEVETIRWWGMILLTLRLSPHVHERDPHTETSTPCTSHSSEYRTKKLNRTRYTLQQMNAHYAWRYWHPYP
jgi:hypothetical protein